MIGALKTTRTMVELKALFFRTPFQWMVAYDCFHISSFHVFFFNLFSFSG
jgi:hypothetical protein